MIKKKSLGQFFTTNVDYILQGFEQHINNKNIIDPFAGKGDLLNWAAKNSALSINGYDIDTKLITNLVSLNDSLKDIPKASLIISNPPYLGKNKMSVKQKGKYDMLGYEDLYLLAIKKIIDAEPDEGILIIPVNFLSAENSDNLRTEFLNKYLITKINYFKEQVFDDTTYNVIAFHFTKNINKLEKQNINITFYPDKTTKDFILEKQYNYRIAGKEISKILNAKSNIKSVRLTEKHMIDNVGKNKIETFFNDKNEHKDYYINDKLFSKINNNIILFNCIDTNANEEGWIKAEDIRTLNKQCLVGKNTSRNIAYITINNCTIEQQEQIISLFNQKLNKLRKKYNSLFLTNFRDNDRKRISFDFCYKLISYCYDEILFS